MGGDFFSRCMHVYIVEVALEGTLLLNIIYNYVFDFFFSNHECQLTQLCAKEIDTAKKLITSNAVSSLRCALSLS